MRTWGKGFSTPGKKRIAFCSGVILLCSFVFMATGVAQEDKDKAEKLVLTLQQLIDRIIAKSPGIGETQSEIAVTRADLDQVKAAYYPQLESVAVVGPVNDAKRPVVVGTRITDPSPDTVGVFGRVDFAVAQPLYTFGKLSNRKEAATRGVKAKELRLVERKNEIALRVKELYYALVLSRAGVDAANDADSFFEDARQRMKRLLELGSPNVLESDLYRIDAYRADTEKSRAEAEKGASVSYFALKSHIQLPPRTEFDVAEKTLPLKEESLSELESYIQRAYGERPEFKQLDEALAAQESMVRAVQSDRYPSFFVTLEGSLAGAPGRETFRNAYIPDEFNHTNVGVVAGVKWNFDFGISKAKVDKEKAEYGRLHYTKASAKLDIPIQVAKYYQDVKQWKVAVVSYKNGALSSRKWVVAALTSFDMGVGTADDMLRAIEKYGENQGKYLEALFNYNLSLAQLEYAIGAKVW
ncbi:MAG TPA: TolC family protein [Thermodesulfobacteriota bacterium]|nr:TolC family protein [Thermodesulfobacteriota bacterium]